MHPYIASVRSSAGTPAPTTPGSSAPRGTPTPAALRAGPCRAAPGTSGPSPGAGVRPAVLHCGTESLGCIEDQPRSERREGAPRTPPPHPPRARHPGHLQVVRPVPHVAAPPPALRPPRRARAGRRSSVQGARLPPHGCNGSGARAPELARHPVLRASDPVQLSPVHPGRRWPAAFRHRPPHSPARRPLRRAAATTSDAGAGASGDWSGPRVHSPPPLAGPASRGAEVCGGTVATLRPPASCRRPHARSHGAAVAPGPPLALLRTTHAVDHPVGAATGCAPPGARPGAAPGCGPPFPGTR